MPSPPFRCRQCRASSRGGVLWVLWLLQGCGPTVEPGDASAPVVEAAPAVDPLAEPLLSIPDTRESWPRLQASSRELVAQGDAAARAVTTLLVAPTVWRRAAVAEALLDRTEPGLEGPTLAVLTQLGAPDLWIGEAAPLTAALDRCVTRLSPDVTGPSLAQMIAHDTPLAERAAHHFVSRPPAAADALLETLMRSTGDAAGRHRLARTLLGLPGSRTAVARAHNAMRRADLLVALAFLDVEPSVSPTPLFQDSVVGELVVRLLLVPQKELGDQEKLPVALGRYPSARALLQGVMDTGTPEDQQAVARVFMASEPTEAELRAVLNRVEAGALSPEVLTGGVAPWMQKGLLAGMADPARPMAWRQAAAVLLAGMEHPDGVAFLAAHPVPAERSPAPRRPDSDDPRRFRPGGAASKAAATR